MLGTTACANCERGKYTAATSQVSNVALSVAHSPVVTSLRARLATPVCSRRRLVSLPASRRVTLRSLQSAHSDVSQCAAGSVNDISGSWNCTVCPAGAVLLPQQSSLIGRWLATWAGKFASAPGLVSCDKCAAGTFTSSSNSSACAQCDVGRFSDSDGASLCQPCPAGRYAASKGSPQCTLTSAGEQACSVTAFNVLAFRSPGSYAQNGSSSPTPCDAGTFTAGSGQPCTP